MMSSHIFFFKSYDYETDIVFLAYHVLRGSYVRGYIYGV